MKKKILAVCLAVVAVVSIVAAATVYYLAERDFEMILADGYTLTAHTGCEGTDDNTLESIAAGYEAGADIVEFDLHFDPSGVAVLSHDEPEGGCVTLDEAFAEIAKYDGLKVNVDLKAYDKLSQVELLAEKHGVSDRIFYTGVKDENFIAAIKADSPSVAYYLNVDVDGARAKEEAYLMELVEKVRGCGAIGINMKFTNCTKELVDTFRANGLLISIWTVNNKIEMKTALAYGADNITTRYPSTLREIIEENK